MKPLRVLGIETSCDETAAAVVAAAPGERPRILSNIVLSQIAEHEIYGGVVPEIAARTHVTHLDRAIGLALEEAGMAAGELDAVAATAGPGLIGGVIVGLMTAKGMAAALGKPLIAVNHLEGHALSARLTDDVPFPFLLLLVSGGHCLLADVAAVGRYRILGATIDDAVGEAFDKTAKLIGLGYPGGPAVERAARGGDPARYPLPRPLLGESGGCDFSFAGLKTAVRRVVEVAEGDLSPEDEADLAASFQAAVSDVLAEKTLRAMAAFRVRHGAGEHVLVAAGGVAANAALRARLQAAAVTGGFRLAVPPPRLCTDNAAMIAWAGLERLLLGAPSDDMKAPARARWPLAELDREPA